jgi:hypothetical protein
MPAREGSRPTAETLHDLGEACSYRKCARMCRTSATGQERRYPPRPPTVRCSTDSGHIAAPPRTGTWGHMRTSKVASTLANVEFVQQLVRSRRLG